jgi:hypothetical protein
MAFRDDDPVAWLVACEDIRQLANRYAIHYGARDLDPLVELFVPDIRVTRETSGREALKASFDGQFRTLGRVILQVSNHLIDVIDPDDATGIVSCRGEIEDSLGNWIIHQIQYHDTYRRVNGTWGFVKRRHLLWYGHDMPNAPVGLPDANWPASQTGKGELPECLESWQNWTASL